MFTIVGCILLAFFILWLLKKLLLGGTVLYRFATGDTPPEEIARIEAEKAEWDRLVRATTVDASGILLPRLSKEEREAVAPAAGFAQDFSLPSYDPDWKPRNRR